MQNQIITLEAARMAEFDLVIRGGTAATAADVFRTDIGVRGGRIAALAIDLPAGRREIDANGLLVLPGGIDAHCHLDQPTGDESVMADDFTSGTRSAACGGTTTLMPFAAQMKGQSLREAVSDYHCRANGKAFVDYAFHLIVTDPTPQVLGQELPALIRDGYTSFKIYMTYDTLKLSDREILDVLALARSEGALVMIHAENADCVGWLTDRLERGGHFAPKFHAAARPQTPSERPCIARSPWRRSSTRRSSSFTFRARKRLSRFAGREAVVYPSTLKLVRSTFSSPRTTSLRPASTVRSASAARRHAIARARPQSGTACGTAFFRSSPPTTRRSATTIQRASRWRRRRRALRASPMEFRASRRGFRSCSRRACTK